MKPTLQDRNLRQLADMLEFVRGAAPAAWASLCTEIAETTCIGQPVQVFGERQSSMREITEIDYRFGPLIVAALQDNARMATLRIPPSQLRADEWEEDEYAIS